MLLILDFLFFFSNALLVCCTYRRSNRDTLRICKIPQSLLVANKKEKLNINLFILCILETPSTYNYQESRNDYALHFLFSCEHTRDPASETGIHVGHDLNLLRSIPIMTLRRKRGGRVLNVSMARAMAPGRPSNMLMQSSPFIAKHFSVVICRLLRCNGHIGERG